MSSDPYKFEPHSFYKPKRIPFEVCTNCGLIALKNPFTSWVIKMGCNAKDHPQFNSALHRFTGK